MRYLILICLLSCGYQNIYSQSTTVSGTIDISSVLNLTVTSLTGIVSFETPDDYSNSQTILDAASVAIKSNVSWQVSVSAQSAFFQAMTTGASTNMPANVLKLRKNGTTSYLTMSTTAQTLQTGTKGDATATGNTFNTDININPGFNYNAGTYNIGVLFTLSQP